MEDDTPSNVLFELWRAARHAGSLTSPTLSEAGLSPDEFGVYSLLARGWPLTPSDLEHWTGAPATTVSSQLKRLEARGHLTRRADPDDRRSWLLELSPSGRAAHAAATDRYRALLDAVVGHLGDKEPAVQAALVDLREAIAAARSHPPASSPEAI